MMRLSLIVAALMVTFCAGERVKQVVRNKHFQGIHRIAPEDLKAMTTGFSNSEDVPTLAEKGKVNSATSVSTVTKADASGPSFSSEDDREEHPNVVDKFQYDTQNSIADQSESSISLPMLLFLACGAAAITWTYASEEKRSEAKDKANSAMQMVGPLVQEAVGALSIAMQGASAASNVARHTSIHSRFLQQSSYQQVGSDDQDDLMAEDDEHELDDRCNLAAGIEESFVDTDMPEEVPQLMQVKPPLDLLDDSAPAPLLDFGVPAQTPDLLAKAFD